MAKSKEELVELKNEYEALATKLKELSIDELKLVTGGVDAHDHNVMLTETEKKQG